MEIKAIKAYRIEELPGKVREHIIQKYLYENDWDNWYNERNKSFMAICELLEFQLFSYDDKGYGVGVEAFNADEVKGASRVIAYIVNRFPLKKAMYSVDEKKNEFYKVHSDSLALNRYTLWMPTGYVADFALKNAFDAFVKWVRKFHTKDTCTLANFCHFLEDAFNEELNHDYKYETSDDFVIEMLSDDWFAEDGTNITYLIEE